MKKIYKRVDIRLMGLILLDINLKYRFIFLYNILVKFEVFE